MPDIKVFDLHCDTIDALAFGDSGPFVGFASTEGDLIHNQLALSVERMRSVGSWCQCYAIWVPDQLQELTPLQFYRRARDYFQAQMAIHSADIVQVRDARTIDEMLAGDMAAALLTVENGSPVGSDLGIVDEWATDGVKMVTLTWNAKNAIGSGHDTTDGLSSFGRKAVRALEDHRIVVDVSHLNDAGFWDLMKVIRRPIAASHSNLRVVCGHKRNLTDDQFRAIMDSGGIVGLNYCIEFVRDEAQLPRDVSFEDMATHIERFLDLGGERSIALGSDFDGCTTPDWLASAGALPTFYQRVIERFGQDVADALFFQNAHDFFLRNETV